MTDKSNLLVRDIAKLFAKYDLDDWRIVITALAKQGREYATLAMTIEQLATRARTRRSTKKENKLQNFLDRLTTTSPSRAEILKDFYDQLRRNRSSSASFDLTRSLTKLGIVGAMPKRKEDAFLLLFELLSEVPDVVFVETIRSFPVGGRDLQNEFN